MLLGRTRWHIVPLTFNQGVTGSIPVRPTRIPIDTRFLDEFLTSRRQGTSPRTTEFYRCCLKPFVNNYELNPQGINAFLNSLNCNNGRNGYYRAIRAFCNWLYRQGYIHDNPITRVDPPKMTKIILPSLTPEQVDYLIDSAETIRDKAIISIFADSGIRLTELLNIRPSDIDLDNMIVTVWGKGGKQRKAPFTVRSRRLLEQVIGDKAIPNMWGLSRRGIQIMLYRLKAKTGLPCNPHTFRRTFASNLHRCGLDVEHIMRLGGWESLDMVVRYTRSVRFEESLKVFRDLEK
ncbi:MAG: tyrosine-type recombinase/integrase [Dehalococcoidales bacterium]|nr:tyrosine-type recombinase/integrase [Dehalococcoidales bacterium]